MRCNQCPAEQKTLVGYVCAAGIRPYILKKSKQMGCCCNTAQVKKYMEDEQFREDAVNGE